MNRAATSMLLVLVSLVTGAVADEVPDDVRRAAKQKAPRIERQRTEPVADPFGKVLQPVPSTSTSPATKPSVDYRKRQQEILDRLIGLSAEEHEPSDVEEIIRKLQEYLRKKKAPARVTTRKPPIKAAPTTAKLPEIKEQVPFAKQQPQLIEAPRLKGPSKQTLPDRAANAPSVQQIDERRELANWLNDLARQLKQKANDICQ